MREQPSWRSEKKKTKRNGVFGWQTYNIVDATKRECQVIDEGDERNQITYSYPPGSLFASAALSRHFCKTLGGDLPQQKTSSDQNAGIAYGRGETTKILQDSRNNVLCLKINKNSKIKKHSKKTKKILTESKKRRFSEYD